MKRQPKGTPVGGQFAEGRNPECDAELTDPLDVAVDAASKFTGQELAGFIAPIPRYEIKVRNKRDGESVWCYFDEDNTDEGEWTDPNLIEAARFVSSDETTGAVTVEFATGRRMIIQSADLDIIPSSKLGSFSNPDFSVRNSEIETAPLTDEQNRVADAYRIAALWASTDDDGEPLDSNHDPDEISDESNAEIERNVVEFWERAKAEGLVDGVTPEQFGHDFFLTQNHHGAGFWDRGRGYAGDRLSEMAHSYKEKTPIIGDDGKIHFEG